MAEIRRLVMGRRGGSSPVRMVWKASSTFDESNADVSRKDRPCFSVQTHHKEHYKDATELVL